MKYKWHLCLLLLVYFFFRLYQLPSNLNFSDDQGRILLETYNIWQEKKLTLIGPPTSVSVDGRQFFHGSITYYFLMPIMALFNWQVIAGSYFLIGLNLISLFLIYFSAKKLFGYKSGIISALAFAVFPETVFYTKFIWNPNYLFLISSLIISLLAGLWNLKPSLKNIFIGILLGLGLQFHYQVILLSLILVPYLFLKSKSKLSTLALTVLGFCLGYLPIIIFELRNNFYNLKTIYFILRQGGTSQTSLVQNHYYLSFIPFIIVYFFGYLTKLSKTQKWLNFVIGLFLGWSVFASWNQINTNRGMPGDWRFPYLQQAAKVIQDQNPNNFNIANIISGDTRAHALRYLLTVKNIQPMGFEDYPQAQNLYVISSLSEKETKNHPVWEIQSFNGKITQHWPLDPNNQFHLYLMTNH
jgi:hypothetical protein